MENAVKVHECALALRRAMRLAKELGFTVRVDGAIGTEWGNVVYSWASVKIVAEEGSTETHEEQLKKIGNLLAGEL